tara:strand:+ start:6174 stop:7385 length:1212 start_codon:yes stop_codon:yes gene_type:complete
MTSLLLSNKGSEWNNKYYLNIKNLFNDPTSLYIHNKLRKKYGSYINIYIITLGRTKYILDTKLIRKIFNISPETKLLTAGLGKQQFGNSFMKNNVAGVTGKNWKIKREFNEKSFDTKYYDKLSYNIINIINKNIDYPKNIAEFKNFAYTLCNNLIYGNKDSSLNLIKDFRKNYINTGKNIYKCPFFNKYKNLSKNIKIDDTNILKNFRKFNFDDKKIDLIDQIPHCIVPFIIMFSFLLPSLLIIIYNFKNIKNKILYEINNNVNIYSKHTYLHYFVIEHIRMFNPINLAGADRLVLQDFEIDGIKFKKGDNLFTTFTPIRFDSNIYNNPNLFIPERWKNKTIDEQNEVFGIGPQQCPSVNISPLIYKCLIIKFLKNKTYKLIRPIILYNNIIKINPYDINFLI